MHTVATTVRVDGARQGRPALCGMGRSAVKDWDGHNARWAARSMVAMTRQCGMVDGASRVRRADCAVDAAATGGRHSESGCCSQEWGNIRRR